MFSAQPDSGSKHLEALGPPGLHRSETGLLRKVRPEGNAISGATNAQMGVTDPTDFPRHRFGSSCELSTAPKRFQSSSPKGV
jgi:hypothetical protein